MMLVDNRYGAPEFQTGGSNIEFHFIWATRPKAHGQESAPLHGFRPDEEFDIRNGKRAIKPANRSKQINLERTATQKPVEGSDRAQRSQAKAGLFTEIVQLQRRPPKARMDPPSLSELRRDTSGIWHPLTGNWHLAPSIR